MKRILCSLLLASLMAACAAGENGAPSIRPPQEFINYQNASGVMIGGEAHGDQKMAESLFGFDILGAGILPVQLVLDNRSGQGVEVVANRTYLVARGDERWKPLQNTEALARVGWDVTGKDKDKDIVPGTAAGALLEHAISPLPPPGKLLKKGIEGKLIPSGGTASGFLYFPGEAVAARELRLQVRFRESGQRETLVLRLR